MFKKIYTPQKARIAQFMSGSGTNVRRVLEQEVEMEEECPYESVVIVTDDKRSNAAEIAIRYIKPLVIFDIRDFQKENDLGRKLSLATKKHREVREEYTRELINRLKVYNIDFAVFGGFEPLTNITKEFPCLNIHPGDLTYLDDNGERSLVGLYTVPIQKALDEKIGYVRSSVIQAMPYTGKGENMDNGPILGLGPKLFYEDEKDAETIQNKLKIISDWKILPEVVLATARGEIEVDYKTNEVMNPVIMDLEFKMSEVE